MSLFSFLADWDSLLEEANRKQQSMTNDHSQNTKTSLFLLTNQKGFIPERYSLKTYEKTDVVTLPMTPDGGETASTNMTETDCATPPLMFSKKSRHGEDTCSQRDLRTQHHIQRMHSSPVVSCYGHRDISESHSPVLRTSSQPVGHCTFVQTHDYLQVPNTNHNQPKNKHLYNDYSERWYANYYEDNKRLYLSEVQSMQDYDIMMNQC